MCLVCSACGSSNIHAQNVEGTDINLCGNCAIQYQVEWRPEHSPSEPCVEKFVFFKRPMNPHKISELARRLSDLGFQPIDRLEQIQRDDLIAYLEDDSRAYIFKVRSPNISSHVREKCIHEYWSIQDHELIQKTEWRAFQDFPKITSDIRLCWMATNNRVTVVDGPSEWVIFETKDVMLEGGEYRFGISPGFANGKIPIDKCLRAPDSLTLRRQLCVGMYAHKNDFCPCCWHGTMELVSCSGPHPSSYGGKVAYTETVQCDKNCGFRTSYEDILET